MIQMPPPKGFHATIPRAEPGWSVRTLGEPNPHHAFHGLHPAADDRLLVCDLFGRAIWLVDPDTGEREQAVRPPFADADDVILGPDGRIYWTAVLQDAVFAQEIGGAPVMIADGLPGVNGLTFDARGRLFVTFTFLGDGLYEVDPKGERPPRAILEEAGSFNGCQFGEDGWLYTPRFATNSIVRVDVDTGAIETVADGFPPGKLDMSPPNTVKFSPDGVLYAVQNGSGLVWQVDHRTGAKSVLAEVMVGLDNLTFDSRGRLFVTSAINDGLYEVDRTDGSLRTILEYALVSPQSPVVVGDTLYIADMVAVKGLDRSSGDVKRTFFAVHLEFPKSVSVRGNRAVQTGILGGISVLDLDHDRYAWSAKGFPGATRAVLDDRGDALVATGTGGSIARVTQDGGRGIVANGFEDASDVLMAPDGRLWLADCMAGVVLSVDPATGERAMLHQGLHEPIGIAAHPDGSCLVLERATRSLVRCDDDMRRPMASNLAFGQDHLGHPLMRTQPGVAVAADGTAYVTSDTENVIYAVTAA